jgi:CHASE2 domain-containing sensor protein/signal transduction histidine kinase
MSKLMNLSRTPIVRRLKAVPLSVLREWLFLTVALCAIGYMVTRYETLSPLDALWYDSVIARQPLPVPTDVVLITIEPDTLDRRDLGRRTWSKEDSAELLDRLTLGKPAVVLLDIPMPVSDHRDPAGEETLSAAIQRNGKVVLPIFLLIERGAILGFRLPRPRLANYSVALGHDKAVAHPDGVTRRLPLSISNGVIDWPHVVLPVLQTANAAASYKLPSSPHETDSSGRWRETEYLYLRFIDNNAAFETYSARQILNGGVAPEQFRGKIVLIGSSLADTAVVVPGSWPKGRTVWGLELFANAINTVRHEAWPTAVAPTIAAPVTVGLILLTLLSFLGLPDRGAFAITLAAVCLVSLSAWVLLSIGGIWFPHASFAVTTAIAYPLWAWRRLAATYRFVGLELNRMRAEPGVVAAGPSQSGNELAEPALIDQQLAAIQEATAKLRVARKYVADIIEGLPIGVIVSDLQGEVVLANRPAIRAVGAMHADELRGRSLKSVLHPFRGTDDSSVAQTDWTVDHSRELSGLHQERYWLACRQIADEHANRVGAIIALADISALRQAEAQREELLRFLSHDMRSPLASILALIELRRESAEQSNDNERFEEIKRYAAHTLSLAEEFLQVAYATTSNPSEFAIIDLTQATETGIDLVRPLARERSVRIDQSLPESAPFRGNHNLISRMFANVVHNAIKFSPPGSVISVVVERLQSEWVCQVRDQGEGIAASRLSSLFEPYTRLPESRSVGSEGRTQLGLRFVKVVAEKHGGALEISAETGFGTAVKVRLPALDEVIT